MLVPARFTIRARSEIGYGIRLGRWGINAGERYQRCYGLFSARIPRLPRGR